MTELEREIFDYLRSASGCSIARLELIFRDYDSALVRQALANLIAANMVQGSTEMPIKYSVTSLKEN